MMSDALTLKDRVARGQKHLATEAGDTVIILSVDHGVYCGLDDIGSDIWRRLDQPMTIADLRDVLVTEYRGDREEISADVLDLLSSLHAQGMIDVV